MGTVAARKTKSKTFKPSSIIESVKYSRAMEAVNWGMPMVNFDLMYQAAKNIGASFNQIVYWSDLPDWKNQTLTPNPDVIYLMPFFNTKEVGPVVLEIPPADDGELVGSIMDCWQAAIEDIGTAGVDKGRGGKYLILPPEYKQKAPPEFLPMPSDNYQGYALIRSVLKSGSKEDIHKAVKYSQRIKIYPLMHADYPMQTVFVDALGKLFDSTIQYDLRFFQSLDRMVQSEPWLTRDKLMIDTLKTIGIEKGKSFSPDLQTEEILNYAIRDAHQWMNSRYETLFAQPFFDGTHWAMPASKQLIDAITGGFADPNNYPEDDRGLAYTYAFFSARHLGAGQYYLMTVKDKDDKPFEGSKTYKLNVPAKAPVSQYWSATVYDRETHAFIRDKTVLGFSSQKQGQQINLDGSVDIYFGPKAPKGKESNWVPTNPKNGFEVLFRFYGPEKELFDKKWKMEDIEKVQ